MELLHKQFNKDIIEANAYSHQQTIAEQLDPPPQG